MAEKPIPFSGPMVLAILREVDPKWMTRRVMKQQPCVTSNTDAVWYDKRGDLWRNLRQYVRDCAPYKVGDRLWVREAWRTVAMWDHLPPNEIPNMENEPIKFEADAAINKPTPYPYGRYRCGRFMPRCISRITLEVTGVRVERVQDISRNDCYAEGCFRPQAPHLGSDVCARDNARGEFMRLWNSINGKTYPWESNPWVWVYEFRMVDL